MLLCPEALQKLSRFPWLRAGLIHRTPARGGAQRCSGNPLSPGELQDLSFMTPDSGRLKESESLFVNTKEGPVHGPSPFSLSVTCAVPLYPGFPYKPAFRVQLQLPPFLCLPVVVVWQDLSLLTFCWLPTLILTEDRHETRLPSLPVIHNPAPPVGSQPCPEIPHPFSSPCTLPAPSPSSRGPLLTFR